MNASKHRSGDTAQAAWLLSYGAFDIATVRVPDGYRAIARCLERYLIDAHLARDGFLPPLNSTRVTVEREMKYTGRVDRRLLAPLVAELDQIAGQAGRGPTNRR